MSQIYSKANYFVLGKSYLNNTFFGGTNQVGKAIHISINLRFPQVVALKLPTNVVDINAAEVGRFSPLRERDISGPVINSYYKKQDFAQIDVTSQPDPHVNKYDCRGAVSLSSSMQSNVPSPFSGNHTHLGMPGSQWGQGNKYLSDHLHSAHYLTLRNEYRDKALNSAVTIGRRNMSTENTEAQPVKLSAKEKIKNAVKEYGSTVIVFHVTISIFSLGGCYLLVSSGVDLVAILKSFNIGEGTVSKLATSNAGTFVIAYAVHKVFAPVRMAITLAATPFLVRYLRQIGIIKRKINIGDGNGK
ncbi:hypothetical protein MSG28_002172 [Choristoneura fumiferana]|uniref:Uncharacterized protein n=1 Tax=Choristoneura fumiferana TaxID=7141 RepID=A0ACC0JU68_CHOFU|nr:hypothetical protein MSG28_002172 [Choristoneura fumiferana]